MERLTLEEEITHIMKVAVQLELDNEKIRDENYKLSQELESYKEAEEQGLLVRLPCKVGDTVYVPTRNFVSELKITLVSVNTNEMAMYFSWLLNSGIYPNLDGFSGYELGKTVFLTREEAKKKLEEMKKND